MRIYITKLKRRKRKLEHVKYLENRINELHNDIIKDILKGNDKLKVYNKSRLLIKYNRRLKLILY
jgi:hypothetical protein|tara:strand:- start:1365 stop:1559 length:195 start_codon:yes stop_codon:yes gene_type:complete